MVYFSGKFEYIMLHFLLFKEVKMEIERNQQKHKKKIVYGLLFAGKKKLITNF